MRITFHNDGMTEKWDYYTEEPELFIIIQRLERLDKTVKGLIDIGKSVAVSSLFLLIAVWLYVFGIIDKILS